MFAVYFIYDAPKSKKKNIDPTQSNKRNIQKTRQLYEIRRHK